jgi:LysR family hydrogen peroxide-inducible transcriptional activator
MPSVYLPTIKQMQYLIALKDEQNFGRAAEACGVSQSAMSSGIKEMEQLLGTPVVERNRRTMRFTDVGERIVERARDLVRGAQDITDLARTAGRPLTGMLRINSIPTIAPFFLPLMMRRLRAEYPELKVYLREETSGSSCDSLAKGRTDCVILALPFDCGDVEIEPLFDDRLHVAFPSGEPVSEGPYPAGDVDPTRLLLLEDGHCLTQHSIGACGLRGSQGDAAMMGTSLHTIVQMVDSGLGTTILPEMAIDAGILDGTDVVHRPLMADQPARRIALIWRRGSARESDFRLLADVLRRTAAHA